MMGAYDDDANTTTSESIMMIVERLSSPLVASLLATHPNDVTLTTAQRPAAWHSWWDWAASQRPAWLWLMRYYARPVEAVDDRSDQIPPELRALVDAVRSLQLDRTPAASEAAPRSANDRAYRMSPKKEHEVDRMAAYVRSLVHAEDTRSVWHAVDVGSGQGYLSRALRRVGFHVLALDNDEHQTSGANRWTPRRSKRNDRGAQEVDQKGSLTHRTVQVCPQTLDDSITDWLRDPPGAQQDDGASAHHSTTPVPVMMVALHACGSLTIDVVRTFLSGRMQDVWRPLSLVVVGCCYNLMSPSDFPLSKRLGGLDRVPKLTIAARHLAAQVPSQWLKDDDALRSAELALRKVVYRALLQPVLQAAAARLNVPADQQRPLQPGLGETLENRRLGKLDDKAYQDWPTFLERATTKLDVDLAAITTLLPDWSRHEAARVNMENALLVVQTLRCILGPMIESLILLDRREWIRESLAEMSDRGREVEVELVNLFDQATGSGRNVALVIKTATVSAECSTCDRTRLGIGD